MEVAPQYQNIPPFLTETELEVAVILSELPELLRDPGDRPHIPPQLRWGARRRRRSPRLRSSSSPSAAIPEDDPSPSTSLPHRPPLDDETKGDAAATAAAAAAAAAAAIAGSPSSPLSFPASGSEEPESHHPPPPPPLPAPSITSGMKYSSKNSKHHNQMLKEYSHVVASLSAESSILRQEIEQYKIKCTKLKAENSQLIEHRSKLLENQRVSPKLPEAEAEAEAEAAPSAVGAPPADWAAEHRQRSATAKRKVEFDLNQLSEEAEAAAAAAEREADAAAAAQSAHEAAKSAKARRMRRMEIQRAKRIAAAAAAAATAVSAPGSMPSTVHKMPRLR